MNDLIFLRSCKNSHDLALLLGFTPKLLSYTLYSSSIHLKYKTFDIDKKNGGKRTILAPNKDLKKIQKALANLLNNCFNIIEIERLNSTSFKKCILSHGFRPKLIIDTPTSNTNRKPLRKETLCLGIYSNAYKHKNKKAVLNIDLKDFFNTITFNRIVGYFCKNEHFLLDKKVAIIIAQIATFRDSSTKEGYLPQGSPCSPIISNLIGGILDNRLNDLSKRYNCTYSRYADDLTFSTNISIFPSELYDTENDSIGKKLSKIIKDSWFEINTSKTRLTFEKNRQEVTGLVVNRKVNISANYYRYTRSMVHNYCINSIFSKSNFHNKPQIQNISALTGIVNYIFNIKKNGYVKSHCFREFEKLDSIEKFYVNFHFHKEFIHNTLPYIICEGITDPLHLKNAFINLHDQKNPFRIKSIEEIKSLNAVMGLSNGVGPMIKFLIEYSKINKSNIKNQNACIFLVDGDSDGSTFIKSVRDFYKQNHELEFTNYKNPLDPLLETYHITNNIYITQLPKKKCIEDIYDPSVLALKLNGRVYNSSNKSFDLKKFYGKIDLINKVIKPASNSISFDNFNKIFNTISHIQIYNFLMHQP